jgi:hypothetical protein
MSTTYPLFWFLSELVSGFMISGYFYKKDIDYIKSGIDEIKNMEQSKLQSYTDELAKKKIREHPDINKK